MFSLLFAAEEIAKSPEPVINAVLAALEAQRSALLTNWLLVSLIIIAAIVAIGTGFIMAGVNQIREHTNGMQTALVEATRKLALIEGEVKGRAAQVIEDSASEPKPTTTMNLPGSLAISGQLAVKEGK